VSLQVGTEPNSAGCCLFRRVFLAHPPRQQPLDRLRGVLVLQIARVRARPTGGLTDLVDELFYQPVFLGPGELLVDAVVLHLAICNGADDCRDGIDSAESVIQGTSRRHAGHSSRQLDGWSRCLSVRLTTTTRGVAQRAITLSRSVALIVSKVGGFKLGQL
jgi:hypothetical protein